MSREDGCYYCSGVRKHVHGCPILDLPDFENEVTKEMVITHANTTDKYENGQLSFEKIEGFYTKDNEDF